MAKASARHESVSIEAVVLTGGKQYWVAPGQLLQVEQLPQPRGAAVELKSVLLVKQDGQVVADPKRLAGAKVLAEVVAQTRARKITVVKFKRRRNYRRHRGHRQPLTTLRITKIEV